MDIVCTLAYPSGINGWDKAGFGLDGTIHHCLVLLAVYDTAGWKHTAMAKGVPLEAEPGHECYLKAAGCLFMGLTDQLGIYRQG